MNPEFRIFIVEDSVIDRTLLETTLGKVGTVEAFSTAEACFRRIVTEGEGTILVT
jgi:CheY-like chemotaxis protein